MSTQIFTTIPDQIEILKNRGLAFRSIERAAEALQRHGYYNVINGYKDNYVCKDNSSEMYRDGIYFEQIYSLFNFDHAIRNAIMIAMLEVEEQLKTQLAYVVAENFTADYKKYSDIKNYRNTQIKNKHYSLSATLSKLNEAYNSGKDPIRYNRETYGNVPPWVLFKGLYFSTVVTFTRYLKGSQKEELLALMFDVATDTISSPHFKELTADILVMFKEYRNICAHGGRIYNYTPDKIYVAHDSIKSSLGFDCYPHPLNGLGLLLVALSILKDKQPYAYLNGIIKQCASIHCQQYPDDTEYLIKAMGLSGIINIGNNDI